MRDEVLKIRMAAVVGAVAVTALAGATSADALTIAGGGSFSAAAGMSGARFVVDGAPGTSSAVVSCPTASATPTFVNGVYTTPAVVGTVGFAFGGFSPGSVCTGPSSLAVTVTCAAPATLNLTSPTAGSITNIVCDLKFPIIGGCGTTITGSVPITYGTVGGLGRLTVSVLGQSWTKTPSTCPGGIFGGNGVSFGGPKFAALTDDLPYTLTTAGPSIS